MTTIKLKVPDEDVEAIICEHIRGRVLHPHLKFRMKSCTKAYSYSREYDVELEVLNPNAPQATSDAGAADAPGTDV